LPLFEFDLVPLVDVVPWGEEPDLSLGWYGLTDGYYYMNVGDVQLFRYSDEIMQRWSDDGEKNQHRYFEYQVARIYEDILYALPEILQPIPDSLFELIGTIDKQIHWSAELSSIHQAIDEEETEELKSRWFGWRPVFLDTS